jgi:hypothetical protein
MRSRSLVDRLLAVSLFSASSLGTLALFGSVPMLPHLTARLAAMLPDLSEFARDDLPVQPLSQQPGAWVAQLPDEVQPRSVDLLRYRVPR